MHKRSQHTRGANDTTRSIQIFPLVDDISLLDISDEEPNQITLEERCLMESTNPPKRINTNKQGQKYLLQSPKKQMILSVQNVIMKTQMSGD